MLNSGKHFVSKALSGVVIEPLEQRRLMSGANNRSIGLLPIDTIAATSSIALDVVPALATPAPTLPAPGVSAPGSSTSPGPVLTTSEPTFHWSTPGSSVSYTGFQLNLFNQTTGAFASYTFGKTVTSYTPTSPLAADDEYVWNLRLLDGSASGPPSTYLYFQTPGSTLPAPVVDGPGSSTSPGPVLTTLTPTFTWTAESSSVSFTGYQLNLENLTTNTFTSYTFGKTATSYTPTTPLAAGDKYVWNLRLLDGSASGPPSTYLYFQTPASHLIAPIVTAPGSTQSPGPILTTFTPTFTWKAVTGVTFTGYQINLFDLTTNTSTTYKVGTSVTSYTPTTPLTPGDKYVWNLRLDNGSASGPPSTYLYFQEEALPAPVIMGPGTSTSPGPVLTSLDPTFTWKAVTGVTFDSYQINLYDITTKQFQMIQVSHNATSYTLPAGILQPGDMYVWNLRLKVGDVTGQESQPYLFFQTPAKP